MSCRLLSLGEFIEYRNWHKMVELCHPAEHGASPTCILYPNDDDDDDDDVDESPGAETTVSAMCISEFLNISQR